MLDRYVHEAHVILPKYELGNLLILYRKCCVSKHFRISKQRAMLTVLEQLVMSWLQRRSDAASNRDND